MTRRYFVTGTDTGVGKTVVSAGLLRHWAAAGLRTVGMKPVASGCTLTPQGLRNADALALMAAMTESVAYEAVNPVALEPAIAPHLAAADAGVTLDPRRLAEAAAGLPAADVLLVEGAGGWRVPLGPGTTFADLARDLGADVILVVGIRLGCINHALLTAESILADGVTLAGWVASCNDRGTQRCEQQIQTLEERIPAPRLATVPYLDVTDPAIVASTFGHRLA